MVISLKMKKYLTHMMCFTVLIIHVFGQNHVNLVHRKGRTKVCPHPGCGKKFYLSNHLHRHMIIHSGTFIALTFCLCVCVI